MLRLVQKLCATTKTAPIFIPPKAWVTLHLFQCSKLNEDPSYLVELSTYKDLMLRYKNIKDSSRNGIELINSPLFVLCDELPKGDSPFVKTFAIKLEQVKEISEDCNLCGMVDYTANLELMSLADAVYQYTDFSRSVMKRPDLTGNMVLS